MRLRDCKGNPIGARHWRQGGFLQSKSSSKTYTSITSDVEKSPVTADNESVAAGGNVSFFQPTTGDISTELGPGAQQFNLKKKSKLVINYQSDPNLLRDVLGQQQQTLQEFLSSQAAGQSQAGESLADALAKIGELAESKQTGGETLRDRTVLYIILAGLAAVAVIFGKRAGIYIVAGGAALWFLFGREKEKGAA